MHRNGDFVVTWSDYSQSGDDSSGLAVRGQVFTASGGKQGSEFLVNTTTASHQQAPSVTGLGHGGFVVTWSDLSQSGGDSSGLAVRGQVFTASGGKEGNEFLVNTTTANHQHQPSVTGLANDNFVVSWQGNGPGDADGIFARILSYSSAPQTTPGTGGAFTEDAGPVAVAPGLTVADPDSTALAQAVVRISAGLNAAQDLLAFTPGVADVGDITVSVYDVATGTLVLHSTSDTATLAQWQTALRSVTYENSSQAPTGSSRTLAFTLSDAQGAGETSTTTLSVQAVDDAPTGLPLIEGTAEQGQTLSVNTAALVDPDGIASAFSYQWLRDGADIGGATAGSYTLTQADVGQAISVRASPTAAARRRA